MLISRLRGRRRLRIEARSDMKFDGGGAGLPLLSSSREGGADLPLLSSRRGGGGADLPRCCRRREKEVRIFRCCSRREEWEEPVFRCCCRCRCFCRYRRAMPALLSKVLVRSNAVWCCCPIRIGVLPHKRGGNHTLQRHPYR